MNSDIKPYTIIVGSRNPVKIQATLNGFKQMFPNEIHDAIGVQANSQVSNQPKNDQETLLGAQNRALSIRLEYPHANYWVGIEGGIEETSDNVFAFAWVVILSKTCHGKGRTGAFALPTAVVHLIHDGKELGEADDLIFNTTNSKQEMGAVGLLTANLIDRQRLYEHAVILALIPFKNPDLYCAFLD